jgi:hypothetical protein
MPAVPAAGVDFMKSERAAWKNGPLVKHVIIRKYVLVMDIAHVYIIT